jgi:glycosyltransferase involved in cell wall biosynthesis
MRRVAVVTPWFGAGLRGGAERQSHALASRLAARAHTVEVLTTCVRSFYDDWSIDTYAPGVSTEEGLTVRRFRVDPRDARAFDKANAALLSIRDADLKVGVSPADEETARAFVKHNINSSSLVEFLRAEAAKFDAVILIPYLYGTTLRGLAAAPARALLQPCLHEEAYAYLPAVADMFRRARRILFNSDGERELALRLYGPGIHTRSRTVGEGVEFAPRAVGRIGESHDDDEPFADDALPLELRGARFILYLGRRDATKNVGLLVRAFRRFKADFPSSDLRLALAGDGRESFDARDAGIFDLGVVAEETKSALLSSARALFQPSRRESFSRVLMEAWLCARPVAAHRECEATATPVERARGGWLAATEEEWARTFAVVDAATEDELSEAGARGRAYAREHADWERVIDRYEEVFDELDEEEENFYESDDDVNIPDEINTSDVLGGNERNFRAPRTQRARRSGRASVSRSALRAVHQLLPDAVSGDAITSHALSISERLRAAGFESRIYAKRRERVLAGEVELSDESAIDPSAGLIYHHSIGSDVTAKAVAHAGAKCLVYHNITPAEFFAPYQPGFAWLLETGRASLRRLARHFPCSVGDSTFNAAELEAVGFSAPGVLPILVDPDRWNIAADERLMRELQDGATNILFTGRIAPNKRQDALVEIFAEYVKHDASARLLIAGLGSDSDPFFRRIVRSIKRLGLARRVFVTGRISDATLLAYYRTAHLYLSPSEHEGFGMPLVESMWFDVPVVARRGTAVTETLADAGLLYDAEASHAEIARLAHGLARADPNLRRRVIASQRVRRDAFTPAALSPIIGDLVRRMEETHATRAAVA